MSHFAALKVNALVKNELDLIAALKEHFGEDAVEVHDEAKKLHGYDERAGKKAHIIVRKDAVGKLSARKFAYNDLGYERMPDGSYTMHVDQMDMSQAHQDKVAQNYAERVATRKLKSQGYTLKREVLKDGVVKLVATKY